MAQKISHLSQANQDNRRTIRDTMTVAKIAKQIDPKQIDLDLIDKLAHLAGLHFDQQEKCALKNDLSRILAFINQIEGIDVNTSTHIR